MRLRATRRGLLGTGTALLAGVAGCLEDGQQDTPPEEDAERRSETLAEGPPVAVTLVPEEPYRLTQAEQEPRVVLPERDGREQPLPSWAEFVVVDERVRARLLDAVEREFGVRPESGIVDGIQVDLMRPVAPRRSQEARAEFESPDESPNHLRVSHVTVRDESETVADPPVRFETVVSSLPRSVDVTVRIDGYEDYVTRVPVVCARARADIGSSP